ncbi:MAG: Gfo/Idh/MocA family oxidoreductase, partial [Chloroflexi bacterium]|nr:Gfo/Idh/MocA family oxidoreductase [Chloroflexota bacterium]
MAKIRCAVIGVGHGMAHIVEVLKHPELELAAVCASSPTVLNYLRGAPIPADLESVTFTAPRNLLIHLARQYPELDDARMVTDYQAVLDMDDVDAVITAVPIYLNGAFAARALRAGKHVLAGKPLAINEEQGVEVVRAVKESGRAFVLCFEFRRSPLMRQVRKIVDSGEIGQVRQFWWNMFRMPFRATHATRERAGGALVAECCHWLDLFDYFQGGAQFQRVAGFGGIDVNTHQDFQDNAVTIVEYASGVKASLNFAYFVDQPEHNTFGIVGSAGKLRGNTDEAGNLVVHAGPAQNRTTFAPNPERAHVGHLGFDLVHDEFVAQIHSDRREALTEAERGLENLRLCLAIQEAM